MYQMDHSALLRVQDLVQLPAGSRGTVAVSASERLEVHVSDERDVTELVRAARAGDSSAWDTLVERYSGLVVGVARAHRLREADVADVFQTVWLRLVEGLSLLREPRALPGWLVTTTRNECLRSIRMEQHTRLTDFGDDEPTLARAGGPDLDEHLLREERRETLRQALASLPEHCRRLLTLLLTDPPTPYEEISDRLDIPPGSIGPTRGRCLDKLRRCPALAALLENPITVSK
jgi:RNA polymerase sigma factor (sigma-70 family)